MSFVHTRRLADYLEMAHMGPAEFKRAVDTRIPRELAYQMDDGRIENARELLQTEGLAATGLIPTDVLATVIEGSEPAKCMRNVLPTYRMKGPTEYVPYGETGTYASIVAEAAEVPMSTETISVGTLTAVKYGERPMISREMVNDASFDAIANEIRKAGYKIENALNREALSVVLESSGTAHDCAAAGTTAAAFTGLSTCVGGLIGKGFMPTDIVFYPTCYGALLGHIGGLNASSADAAIQGGLLPMKVFGANVHICGIADNSSTYVWGYGTNDYIGAIVLDRNSAGAIGMREDINVEQYSDPIRDLVGMKVTARFDAISLVANATYRLQY